MRRVKAIVEYDGSSYCGWQYQDGVRTIQGEIEKALQIIFKEKIGIIGAGRTDTGVHARNQVFHCDIPEYDLIKLQKSLNGLLNNDIVIKKVGICTEDFHARFDAISRSYRYYISIVPTALLRNQLWYLQFPVNLTLLQEGATLIINQEDFQSFCKTGSDNKNFLCKIYKSRWFKKKELLVYEIEANRFLYGMVRALVGTMIDLGRGNLTLCDFENIFRLKDRRVVKKSAPALGLVLEKIKYKI
jgi:tRNA pseudouridine38-40 synthase